MGTLTSRDDYKTSRSFRDLSNKGSSEAESAALIARWEMKRHGFGCAEAGNPRQSCHNRA